MAFYGQRLLDKNQELLAFIWFHNDDSTRYRLIYSFYDPAVRALCLKHVLEKYGSLSHLPTTEQALDKGITYHFMHERLKAKVLKEIIC